MSNWLMCQQEKILVNFDHLVDILCKNQNGSCSVVGYTPSGYGIILFKGTQQECQAQLDQIHKYLGNLEL